MNDKALCDPEPGNPAPAVPPQPRPGGIIIHPGCNHPIDALHPRSDDFRVPRSAANVPPDSEAGYFELAHDTSVRDAAIVRLADGTVFINIGVNIIEIAPSV